MGHSDVKEPRLNMKKENGTKDLKLNFSINLLLSFFFLVLKTLDNIKMNYTNQIEKGKDRYKDQIFQSYEACQLYVIIWSEK